jgi:hypothetical protein
VWARSWSDADISIAQNGTAATPVLAQFMAALGSDLLGCTIMRIRGTLAAQNQAGTAGLHLVWGIRVGDQGLLAAGVDPHSRPNDDWMIWDRLLANQAIAAESSRVDNMKFDIRAKRKMEELSQDLYIGWTNRNNSAVGITVSYALSVLLALP